MRVFLAGCEKPQFANVAAISKQPYSLFSYYHWVKGSEKEKTIHKEIMNNSMGEVICDSGLFTLMFGVGKGGNYDMKFMTDYTNRYIGIAKSMGIQNLTIVESDVHKLLGMPAVFELRKYFEDSGLSVLYVWHKEEGLDGLMRMAEKYDYIALSIPELRVIFKDSGKRYQTITQQLLQQIRTHCSGRMPKIHLLGNTVQETMETTLAYSCDSTSWLSGGRFGTVLDFRNGKLRPVKRTSAHYVAWKEQVYPAYHQVVSQMLDEFGHNERMLDYQISMLYSAMTMRRFQDHLDKLFPWIGLRRAA